ncbi:hypothetical protein BS47DRAFT_1357193 [Hydnum rufescens UP504]|uniref:Uncharacterized protein n=1 Tax=Hydnum rufescens UP504 TaxID=1448309 RepID=A0A9P6E283_9AGAM|nr:hypothetical protein BS47DRAFT_1357193 [Hydnum rufescens UP504]
MGAHTARAVCGTIRSFLPPRNPVELCAEGENTGAHAHPRPHLRILTLQRQISTRRHHFGGVLGSFSSAKPDLENARQCTTKKECAATQDRSRVPQPIRRRNKYGATHPAFAGCHISFLTPETLIQRNPWDKARAEIRACAASHQDLNLAYPQTLQHESIDFSLKKRETNAEKHRQRTNETQECEHQDPDPPSTQPIRWRNKYGATHLLRRIFSLRKTSKEYMGKGRANTGMRAATQDPNFDYSQPIQRAASIRSHTPAEIRLPLSSFMVKEKPANKGRWEKFPNDGNDGASTDSIYLIDDGNLRSNLLDGPPPAWSPDPHVQCIRR